MAEGGSKREVSSGHGQRVLAARSPGKANLDPCRTCAGGKKDGFSQGNTWATDSGVHWAWPLRCRRASDPMARDLPAYC